MNTRDKHVRLSCNSEHCATKRKMYRIKLGHCNLGQGENLFASIMNFPTQAKDTYFDSNLTPLTWANEKQMSKGFNTYAYLHRFLILQLLESGHKANVSLPSSKNNKLWTCLICSSFLLRKFAKLHVRVR